jgi:hypothetical protein
MAKTERYKQSCVSINQLFLPIKKESWLHVTAKHCIYKVTKDSQIWDTIETSSEFNWLTMLCFSRIYVNHIKTVSRKFRNIHEKLHFIQLLKPVELQDQDILVSFDMASLCTNVSIEESLQIIKTKLDTDQEKKNISTFQQKWLWKYWKSVWELHTLSWW